MSLYAFDDIGDAITATRELLWPFDSKLWAKLVVIVFFIGGGSTSSFQFGGGTPSTGGSGTAGGSGIPQSVSSIGGPELVIIGLVAAAILLLGLLFMLVGSIMEFVFVRSLQRKEVLIRRYWSQYWRDGLRLFGFRLVIGVLTLSLIGVLLLITVAPVILGYGTFSLGLVLAVVMIPIGILIAILSGLIGGFTTMFVVPVMMAEECGVLGAWRRFWPTIVSQWKQYLAYAVTSFLLQIAGGIAASIATLLGVLVVAIPLGIVGLLGAGLLTVFQIAGWVVIGIAAVLFVLAFIGLALFAAVPVQTFLRYYALLVLGDTNEAFDLIPEQRQSIRE